MIFEYCHKLFQAQTFKALFLALFVFALSAKGSSGSENSPGADFHTLLNAALENSSTIKASRFAVEEAQEGITQAATGYYPTLNAIGEAGYMDNNDPLVTDGEQLFVGLEVRQKVFDFGRVGAAKRQATAEFTMAKERLTAVETTVLWETVSALLDMAEARDVGELYLAHADNLSTQLDGITEETKAGTRRITEAHLIQARLARSKAKIKTAAVDMQAAGDVLSRLTGLPLQTALNAEMLPEDLIVSLPVSRQQAIVIANTEVPEILVARAGVMASEEAVSGEEAKLYPELGLTGRAQSGKLGGESNEVFSGMISLDMPLYQGGRLYSQVRSAEKKLSRQRQLLEQTMRKTTQEAGSAYDKVVGWQEIMSFWAASIQAEETAVGGIVEEVTHGLRSVTDQLEAQQDLLQVRIEKNHAQYGSYLSGFALQRSIGRLTPENLNL